MNKACASCKEIKDYSSFHSNKGKLVSYCKKCTNTRKNAWRALNAEKTLVYQKGYRERRATEISAYQKLYWKSRPDLVNFHSNKRRASKLNAQVPCLTEQDHAIIKSYYTMAKWLSFTCFVPYHVDHIVPLQHKKVCGLHVPANLAIITASKNHSKGNKFAV